MDAPIINTERHHILWIVSDYDIYYVQVGFHVVLVGESLKQMVVILQLFETWRLHICIFPISHWHHSSASCGKHVDFRILLLNFSSEHFCKTIFQKAGHCSGWWKWRYRVVSVAQSCIYTQSVAGWIRYKRLAIRWSLYLLLLLFLFTIWRA